METSHEVDVISLDAAHRQAFEDVIGAPLAENQRLVISVTAPASNAVGLALPRSSQTLADWAMVYDGLTEDQIEAIDQDINTRANLARSMP
jgi:hypothetical protein